LRSFSKRSYGVVRDERIAAGVGSGPNRFRLTPCSTTGYRSRILSRCLLGGRVTEKVFSDDLEIVELRPVLEDVVVVGDAQAET